MKVHICTMLLMIYTPEGDVANEVEHITYMLDHGADYLFIRKPNMDDFALVDYLEKFDGKYYNKMISTSLILCKEFDMAGYHFTRDIWQKNINYNAKIIEWLHGNHKISSKSAHSIHEINTLNKIFKLLIISPIYKSLTKKNYFYPWNYQTLGKAIENAESQCIAVGGITASNIGETPKLHFAGAGLLGSIWKDQDEPIKAFELIKMSINA